MSVPRSLDVRACERFYPPDDQRQLTVMKTKKSLIRRNGVELEVSVNHAPNLSREKGNMT